MHVSMTQPNPTTYCILSKQAIGEAMLFEASKKSSLLTSTYLFVECIQSFSKENELLPIRLELIYCFIAGMRPSLFRIFLEKNGKFCHGLDSIRNKQSSFGREK